eukprot:5785060-Amphidinium_carterae.2
MSHLLRGGFHSNYTPVFRAQSQLHILSHVLSTAMTSALRNVSNNEYFSSNFAIDVKWKSHFSLAQWTICSAQQPALRERTSAL